MKRHFVSAVFLAAFLAAPALAAENRSTVAGAAGVVAPGAAKESKKAAAKKKTSAEKPVKVARVEKSAPPKSPARTTRRMRGYGN